MAQTSEKFQSLEPKWFDGEFSKLIEIAFRGRIILTQQEALAQFRLVPPGNHRRRVKARRPEKSSTVSGAILIDGAGYGSFFLPPGPQPKAACHP